MSDRVEVTAQLRALGVEPGGVLLVHTSFRAIRPIAGGPLGLIDALRAALGQDGTLVVPSWTGEDDVPFAADQTPAAPDLGVVAELFWRLPEVRRGEHPYAFAAAGPQAERIVGDPLPNPAHGTESPVGRVHELDGQVLLLGVGHDADTTIHLAEALAGVPYRVPNHVTVLRDGIATRIETFETDLRKVAVVGEIGLDGTSRVPLERQKHVLSAVLGVLATRPRIASIHSYRATAAVLELLDRHRPSGAVLHWWLGNEAETRRAIGLGAFFSVNSNQANRWPGLRLVPKDRLLTETDHPFGDRREQGERRPGNVAAVERRLGELLNADPHDVRLLTWRNFRRLADAVSVHDLLPREFQVQLLAV